MRQDNGLVATSIIRGLGWPGECFTDTKISLCIWNMAKAQNKRLEVLSLVKDPEG